MKYLLMLCAAASCYAQQFVMIRTDDTTGHILAVSTGWSSPSTAVVGVPPAGSVWRSVRLVDWTALADESAWTSHQVPVYSFQGGKVVARAIADVQADVDKKKKDQAIRDLIDEQQRLAAVNTLLLSDPANADLLAQKVTIESTINDEKKTAGVK